MIIMLPPGISITDHEGNIVRKNARYDAIVAGGQKIRVGAKPYEVCKGWLKNFQQTLHEKDWPAMQAIAAGKPVLSVEIDVQRLDGSFITILESAKPIMDQIGRIAGATVITQDITHPVLQERILFGSLLARIKNNSDFHGLAQSIPQLVWTVSLTGSIDFFNDHIRQYQGIYRQEDGSWNCEGALYPEDYPETFQRLGLMIDTRTGFKMQHRLRMADGTYRWHDSLMVPVPDQNGQVSRWLGMARDVHDEKMIEQALLNTITPAGRKL